MSGKITFIFAVMGAGKTARLIADAESFEQAGLTVGVFKSVVDTRDAGVVRSRNGYERACSPFEELTPENVQKQGLDVILVDEAQFLNQDEIECLCHVSDDLGVDICCYGLRSNVAGELFVGSYWLMVYADEIQSIPHRGRSDICMHCLIDPSGQYYVLPNTDSTDTVPNEPGGDDVYGVITRKKFFSLSNK